MIRIKHGHWGLVIVLTIGLSCLLPGVSMAHVFPDHSDPRVGSTVSTSPPEVRIWFDGDLEPAFSSITVHTADGKTVDKGDSHVAPKDSTLLEVSVPQLPPGEYLVIWNAVARDGHRTTGKYTFTVR